MDEIQTKVLSVLLLAIHSHLYSFALRFIILQTHTTSYNFYNSAAVHCKGQRRKPDRKPHPLPFGLRNPYRNLQSENSQGFAQKLYCLFFFICFCLLCFSYIPASCSDTFSTLWLLPLFFLSLLLIICSNVVLSCTGSHCTSQCCGY